MKNFSARENGTMSSITSPLSVVLVWLSPVNMTCRLLWSIRKQWLDRLRVLSTDNILVVTVFFLRPTELNEIY